MLITRRFTFLLFSALACLSLLGTAAAQAPIVTLAYPYETTIDGGTTVTIYGSNFRAGATVNFGATAVGAVVNNANQITVSSVPMPVGPGVVDVTVTNTDSSNGTCSRCFSYVDTSDFAYVADAAGFVAGIFLPTNNIEKCVDTNFFLAPAGSYVPVDMALSADGNTLFVAEQTTPAGGSDVPGYVAAVDLTSALVSNTYPCSGSTDPINASQNVGGLQRMIMSPDGHYLYVTSVFFGQLTLYQFDATALLNTPGMVTLTQSTQPAGLAISPDGSTVYIANNDSGKPGFETVTVAGTTLTEGTFTSTTFPLADIVVNPTFPEAYAIAGGSTSGKVAVINTGGPSVSATIQLAVGSLGNMAISHDGSTVYVKQQDSSSIAVINTATRSVLETVSTGSSGVSPFALAPEGGYVFAGLASNAIAVSSPFGGLAASFNTIPALNGTPGAIVIAPPPHTAQTVGPQTLNNSTPNVFQFSDAGTVVHAFKNQYPAGTVFSGTPSMTVTATPTSQAAFQAELAGAFPGTQCVVYAETGGNCIVYTVSCDPSPCPSSASNNINVSTVYDEISSQVNPGFLRRETSTWTNVFSEFDIARQDPTTKGETNGFSDWVAVDLGLAAAPSADLPSAVDFGSSAPGSQRTVKLINDGGQSLHVSAVAASGAGFTSTSNCSGRDLSRGQSCTETVTFNPASTITYSGTLSFTDNSGPLNGTASTSTQVVQLTGLGSNTVPFGSFVPKLNITTGRTPGFDLTAALTLSLNDAAIIPLNGNVSLTVGSYQVTVPVASFKMLKNGSKITGYVYQGTVNGIKLSEQIAPGKQPRTYTFKADATGVLPASSNPVSVTLTIGSDSSTAAVRASFK